jgi:hypothetical protein
MRYTSINISGYTHFPSSGLRISQTRKEKVACVKQSNIQTLTLQKDKRVHYTEGTAFYFISLQQCVIVL